MFGSFGGGNEIYTGDIGHSLRFRSAASAYLNRTFGSPTNASGWAFSTWVKLGNLATRHTLLSGYGDANNRGYLEINDSGIIRYDDFYSGSQKCLKVSNAVLRDPTSWYHIFVLCNTDLATAEDRLQIYVNGVRVTSWSTNTNYGLSVAPQINWASHTHYINNIGNGTFGDGYRARTCFVDNGIALTPSSFCYQNNGINEWVSKSQSAVKAVVDAGGTNSFMLDFNDPNFATYNVGKDYSSKGNHWTPNNFSLTAGTTYDRMLDVPGNSFATLNPVEVGSTTIAKTDGNLKAASTSTGGATAIATMSLTTGKWYFEATVGSVSGNFFAVGALNKGYYSNGTRDGSTAFGATYTTGDVIGVAANADAMTVEFFKNGVSQGTQTGATVSAPYFSITQNTDSWLCNFGQAPLHASATYHSAAGGYFRYAPPSGFKALCQRNMPDPAILNPEKHFDVRLHVGNAASQKVTSDFKPGLVWIKRRNISATHSLFDEIRGASVSLHSETTGADDSGTSLNSIDADGFTLGNNANTNSSPDTFVDWLWKAGGAPVTNNAGSISSQVSANVDAGFSIVTYTGNLTAAGTATVGHGLGRKPSLIISKSRNNAGGDSGQWCVRHQALDINSYKRLNTSDYIIDSVANGNMSAGHTTSVFQTNWTGGINSNGGNFVAYCFADIPGYSKAFWATGNGVADGPFIELGFKPKFLLIVGGPAGAYWNIIDCTRSPYNVADLVIYPNTSGVENNTYAKIDILSSGIKCRAANDNVNYNGYGIIGIAFADVPAKYALAR